MKKDENRMTFIWVFSERSYLLLCSFIPMTCTYITMQYIKSERLIQLAYLARTFKLLKVTLGIVPHDQEEMAYFQQNHPLVYFHATLCYKTNRLREKFFSISGSHANMQKQKQVLIKRKESNLLVLLNVFGFCLCIILCHALYNLW